MVYFGNLSPFDDAMGEMGAPWWRDGKLEVTMGVPWWRNDELGPLDNVMGN